MPEVASGELPGNLKGMTTSGWSGFAPVFDGSALAPPTRVHTMIAEKTLTIVPRRAVRIATQRMSGCGKEEARVVRVRVHVIHETLIHLTAECQGQHCAPTVPWTRCRTIEIPLASSSPKAFSRRGPGRGESIPTTSVIPMGESYA